MGTNYPLQATGYGRGGTVTQLSQIRQFIATEITLAGHENEPLRSDYRQHNWLRAPAATLWNPLLCLCSGHASNWLLPANEYSTAGILRQTHSWEMWNFCNRQISLKDFLRPWQTFLSIALQSKTLLPKVPSFLTSLLQMESDCHHSLTTPRLLLLFPSQAFHLINFLHT